METVLTICSPGCGPYLRQELESHGLPIRHEAATSIETEADFHTVMNLNLHLRTAQRVLVQLFTFETSDMDGFYEGLYNHPWEDTLKDGPELSITSSANAPCVKDPRIVNLKTKDAIVDRLRDKWGHRPNSSGSREGAVVHIYWNSYTVKVYLDTSGVPLSRRGYRMASGKAPMQEALAAACVLATGWNGSGAFINPMCGSGTLAIEAAMIARGTPPGIFRKNFGFLHTTRHDERAWKELRQQALDVEPNSRFKVYATDYSKRVLAAARENAERAGVEKYIAFEKCDFRDTPVPRPPGIVLFNPEYGERLGNEQELEETYKAIGDFLKQRCTGFTGYVFTGNLKLAKKIGLKPSQRLTFFNSQIECRLLEYEMYEGTRNP